MGKRVAVAMSGGVDSSVAAALLQEQGCEVIGVMMNLLPETREGGVASCCGAYAAEDAKQVAHRLNIPFYLFNFQEGFKTEIIDYYCREYAAGRTPNPCILCNERMKFDLLLKKVRQLGISHLATGHYARNIFDEGVGKHILKKGIDRQKDQSYVLFSLVQNQLQDALFPLGGYTKEEVRKIAFRLGFRNHAKPDSQELCFIPDGDSRSFLKRNLGERFCPGPILDSEGKTVGEHGGIVFYTIGQRRGLALARGVPVYVTDIDPVRNAIVIGEREGLLTKGFEADQVNWIIPQRAGQGFSADVKIRYQHAGSPAVIHPLTDQRAKVEFLTPQAAVTAGQAAVFYNEDILLGGGWIHRRIPIFDMA